jgi:hypothetical protein
MTTEVEPTLRESKDRLIAALDVWQEPIDPCANGHVEHGPEGHVGRRIVHTMAGTFGADWDYEAAVAYIRSADRVVKATPLHIAMGHAGAARSPEGRWIAFATKDSR